jgi:uncharacterized protein (DUF4213/DUF364 family)
MPTTVAEDLLSELRQRLRPGEGPGPIPRVRALHLPPAPTPGQKHGEFVAVELDDGSIGLGYALLGDTWSALRELAPKTGGSSAAGPGADALALAGGWRHDDPAARAVGLAAVNALSRHVLDRAGIVPPAAADALGGLTPRPGDHVGMVGLFPPLLAPLRATGARITVLELRADLVGARDGVEITLDPGALAGCQQVLCTATTLLNHTLDGVLAACRGAREFALVGPGAGCLPEPLFRHGVTCVAGTWITDAAGLIDALVQGRPWGRCARKFAWHRASAERAAAVADGPEAVSAR